MGKSAKKTVAGGAPEAAKGAVGGGGKTAVKKIGAKKTAAKKTAAKKTAAKKTDAKKIAAKKVGTGKVAAKQQARDTPVLAPPPPMAVGASPAVLDRLWAVVEQRRNADPAVSPLGAAAVARHRQGGAEVRRGGGGVPDRGVAGNREAWSARAPTCSTT